MSGEAVGEVGAVHEAFVGFGFVLGEVVVCFGGGVAEVGGGETDGWGKRMRMGFQHCMSRSEVCIRVVGWDAVENPVLDGGGEVSGGVAVDGDCSVDGLKWGAVEIEFTVEEKMGIGGEEGWGEMGEDGWGPVVFVAGLEGAVEEQCSHSVQFWLDVEWVGEFVGVVFPAMGEHGFHNSKSLRRETGGW